MDSNINRYQDPTPEERSEICRQLDIEFRGAGVAIDLSKVSIEMRTRILKFHYYNALMPRVVNTENTNYVIPPKREYTDNKGDPLKDEDVEYIEKRMEEMQLNVTMADASKTVAFMGTLALLPEVDEEDGTHNIITLTPADPTWKVKTHPKFPNKAIELEYTTEDKVKHVYDFTHYKQYKEGVEELIESVEHKYKENDRAGGGMPWVIIRMPYDPSRFWGSPDKSLRDICELHRYLGVSILVSTQGNLQDILVLSGCTTNDSVAQTYNMDTGKVLNLSPEFEKGKDGKPIQKSAYFINPSYLEPKAIQDIWKYRWDEFLRGRGHSAKNFEVGASPQSAEAQRLSDAGVGNDNAFKRSALTKGEKDFFKRWIQMNNRTATNRQIPVDAQVSIMWQDDLTPPMKDKLERDKFDLEHSIKTPVDLMMEDGRTLDQAKAKYAENLVFGDEFKPEPEVENEEEPILEGEIEEVIEVDLGDPGNPYKKRFRDGKWEWTWGNLGEWYVGTEDEPPQKLKDIVAAIHASGGRE